jgi:hypothetical protein
MSCINPTDRSEGDPVTPVEEDRKVQRAVLALVLREHPTHLTFPELAAEVCEDPNDFAEGDALARAVRDLGVESLLRSDGLHVLPTRAALYFERLEMS